MFFRDLGYHRSFPDHVRQLRTRHSSTFCWQCSSQYQPWELWQEYHCYCIAEHYKISQPPGTKRIARALGHTHATQTSWGAHGSLGQCVFFSLIDVGSDFTAYVVFFSFLSFLGLARPAVTPPAAARWLKVQTQHNLTYPNPARVNIDSYFYLRWETPAPMCCLTTKQVYFFVRQLPSV